MERWRGKIAVVTGASYGIGEEIARALDKHGMKVVALARSKDKLKNLAESSQERIVAMSCDVQKSDQVTDVFKKIEDDFGGVDVLINNAAVYSTVTSIECPPSEFKNVLDTNILGLNNCTTAALKTMRKRGDDGIIIHLNSILGHDIPMFSPSPIGVYPVSKHALTALTKVHRSELRRLGSRIKITSISPGLVFTEMGKTAYSFFFQKEGHEFKPELPNGYLSSNDISDAVISVLILPRHVEIQELTLTADTYPEV